MKSEYIPYSIKNNVKDPRAAKVVDYIERVMGWDILEYHNNFYLMEGIYRRTEFETKNLIFWIDNEHEEAGVIKINHFQSDRYNGHFNFTFPLDLFYNLHTSLLPEIRDLYKKTYNEKLP